MKVYVYLDESGSIHKNSKTKYFAVGGYITYKQDKVKITSLYKKINKEIKIKRKIPFHKEIKSYNMKDEEKINIFKQIQKVPTFYGCAKIFDKKAMRKEIIESNIFFNYAVKLLFNDCILPIIKENIKDSRIEFIVSIDNRNLRIGDLKNLENYLNTEFCLKNYIFQITYYDSATNFGIQLADLTINTFYNLYKDIEIVKKVIPILNNDNFKVSLFPGFKIGRITTK